MSELISYDEYRLQSETLRIVSEQFRLTVERRFLNPFYDAVLHTMIHVIGRNHVTLDPVLSVEYQTVRLLHFAGHILLGHADTQDTMIHEQSVHVSHMPPEFQFNETVQRRHLDADQLMAAILRGNTQKIRENVAESDAFDRRGERCAYAVTNAYVLSDRLQDPQFDPLRMRIPQWAYEPSEE